MASNNSMDRKNKPPVLGILVLFVIVAVGGAVFVYSMSDWRAPEKIKNMRNPVPAGNEAIAAGMSIYGDRCASCHGERGDGRGEKAEQLSIAPADFTDAQKMNAATDGELFWKISKGRRPMPGFRDKLSELQRWQLVDYIRTFSRRIVDAPLEVSPPAAPNEKPTPRQK